MKRLFLIYLYSLIACWTYALQAVNNGIPWYDQNQNPVNAVSIQPLFWRFEQ